MNMLRFVVTSLFIGCLVSNSHAGQANWQKDWEQTLTAAKK